MISVTIKRYAGFINHLLFKPDLSGAVKKETKPPVLRKWAGIRHAVLLAWLLAWLLAILPRPAEAQDPDEVKVTGRFRGVSLPGLLDSLEHTGLVRFFYRPQWIDTIAVIRDFDGTPLVQFLNSVLQRSGITWKTFQQNGVMIFPLPESDRKRYIDELQLLVIGDPLNEGRYRTALLEGKLVDGKTGDPLPGAVILDTRTSRGTSADRQGFFSMELPTGEHHLQFSYLGYQPTFQKIRLIENGYAEFEIFGESHRIGEVTVTGEQADLPRSQMSLVRMEAKSIRELPALMGETDIMRGMAMQAGVQSVGELSSGFNVRGGNTDQNLLLVNGSPVFNSSHLFGFLSLINPDLVDDVRLFKGGMPARYGERIASVMEVDLRDGNSETLRLSGGVGIINSRLAIDGPLGKNKKLTLTAGGRSSYSDWLMKKIPNPSLSQSTTGFYDLAGKLTHRFNTLHRLSGMVYVSRDEFSTSSQTITRYGSLLANVQARNQLAPGLNGEGNLSFSRYDYRFTDLAGGIHQKAYHLSNRLKYGSLKYNLRYRPSDYTTLEAGINLISHAIDPGEITGKEAWSAIVPTRVESEKGLEGALYASADIRVLPSLTLSPGLRYSHFSHFGPEVVYLYDPAAPRSALTVTDSLPIGKGKATRSYHRPEPRLLMRLGVSPETSLKLNFQRITQYLFQISNNAVIAPADTWKAADYHIPPMTGDQAALGFETAILDKGLEMSVETYYKKLKNLPEYRNGAKLLMNPHIETSLIPAEGHSWGVEIQGRKDKGRLTGWLSYTWSRSMRKTTSPFREEQLRNNRYFPSEYDRPHDLSVVATYHISRRWRFSSNFVYLSGRPVTLPEKLYSYGGESLIWYSDRNKYRMPSYHRLDMALTLDENLRKKRMWKGSWTLSVYNLYGRDNPYSVYYRKTVPSPENDYRFYSLFKLSVIGIPVPSLTYNFRF